MPDDVTTPDAPQETTSEADVPSEEVSETPSDAADEPGEAPAETGDEPDDEDAAEPEPGDEPAEAQASDEDDDEAWKNFQKKFNHLHNDRDRKAAMGRAFWEKTRYASSVRKENEELKARLARAEAKPDRDEKPDEPAPPPPELAKIEGRIQALYQKDQAVQTQQNQELQKLAAADREVAVIEDRLKDTNTEEYQKAILEQRLETAKIKREGVLNRWADLNDKRESISLEMEQRLNDREWTTKFLKDKAIREEQERSSVESFNVEFPKHVDALIVSSADALGAPKDSAVRKSLWKSVNRAMMVDLWQLGEEGLQSVDVPAMVRAHVKEYLEERGLASRAKFSKTSKDKLDTMPGRKPAGTPARSPAKPVPAALLSRGDTTPSMLRARQLLMQRLGGGGKS